MSFFNPVQMQIRREFTEAHGGRESTISIEDGAYFLFPDGAMMSWEADGIVIDPPTDEAKRLKLVIKYHEKLLGRWEENFQQLKRSILATFDGQVKNFIGCLYRGSEDEAMEELKATQSKVKSLRRKWQDAKAKLEKLTSPTPEERRISAEQDAAIANRKRQFRDAVNRVKV